MVIDTWVWILLGILLGVLCAYLVYRYIRRPNFNKAYLNLKGKVVKVSSGVGTDLIPLVKRDGGEVKRIIEQFYEDEMELHPEYWSDDEEPEAPLIVWGEKEPSVKKERGAKNAYNDPHSSRYK